MTRLASLLLTAACFLAGCQTAEPEGDPSHLKVLMIGNSFSISCLTHLPQVAADSGQKLDLGSLYIGGCSLERHATNVVAELRDEKAKGAYRYDRVIDNGIRRIVRDARLTDVLKGVKWDVVTIQQASHLSWRKESFHPWGDDLVKTVRTLAPQAKIVVQETWSYTPFDKRLAQWKISADEMAARAERLRCAFLRRRRRRRAQPEAGRPVQEESGLDLVGQLGHVSSEREGRVPTGARLGGGPLGRRP